MRKQQQAVVSLFSLMELWGQFKIRLQWNNVNLRLILNWSIADAKDWGKLQEKKQG